MTAVHQYTLYIIVIILTGEDDNSQDRFSAIQFRLPLNVDWAESFKKIKAFLKRTPFS